VPLSRNLPILLRHSGKIVSAVVSYRAGWWFVSINVELPDRQEQRDGLLSGIDIGLKTFVVASTGEVFENQKHLAQALAKLRRLQKAQSRKVEGSQNWQKAKARASKAYYKVACQRADRQHKVSTALAQSYTYIGMEDLNVKGLVKNHKLARSLNDAAVGAFKQYVSYKAEQRSGMVIEVGRFFASSRLCHVCGYKNIDLTLLDREWTCPDCHTQHDRDVNAARNIHQEAQRLLMASR
jgi:putative transposase